MRPAEKGWRAFERLLALTQRATGEHSLSLEIVAWAAAAELADRLIVSNEAAADQRGQIVASVLRGYARTPTVAVSREPVTEDWIRGLHATVCSCQQVQAGLVDWNGRIAALVEGRGCPSISRVYPFAKGQYKSAVWHPVSRRQRRRERRHYRRQRVFAPAADVPVEMRRFLDDLNSSAFKSAHPAVQSAFAQYGLVAIHPFQDGNGRVSRLLASIYTLRSHRVPALILVQHYGEYVGALRRADADEYGPLVDFMVRRCRGALARQFASTLAASLC